MENLLIKEAIKSSNVKDIIQMVPEANLKNHLMPQRKINRIVPFVEMPNKVLNGVI